jgi:TatD DNase family protein
MYFVDSHIHFSDNAYDRYIKLIVDIMVNLNIQVYSVSVDVDSSAKNIEIKKKYFKDHKLFKPFVGIHPQFASIQTLESFNDLYVSNKNDVVGIGEIGLDPTYTMDNTLNEFNTQKIVFNEMLEIAEKNYMPVSLHSRRSLGEVLEIISSYNLKNAVFHWFDGSKKFLRKIQEMGYYVSFGPYLLYSEDKRALLKECDLSLLLLETDGPIPYRRCFENVITSPIFVISLINFISVALKEDFNHICDIIYRNSCDYIGAS